MKAQPKLFIPVMWFGYLWHKPAGKDQASMHIRTVSLEPSLIALKRRDVDEGSGKILYTSSCDLVTYRIWTGEPAHAQSITR